MAAAGSKLVSVGLSVVIHAVLLGLLFLQLPSWDRPADQPVRLAIDAAVVVDQEAVRQRELEAQRQREAEMRARAEAERRRKAEERRLARERREAERREAEERAARQRELEARRLEAAARRAEEERLAEQRRLAEERRKQEEAERRERERLEAERKRREAEEARRRAEEQRRQAQREAELQAALLAEQEREAAIDAGLLDQWREVIRQKVQRNWQKPPSAGPELECEVRVRQLPGGDVASVEVTVCNGDAAVVRSIENAVRKASPLPPPPNPALFERNIIFVFRPEE